MSVFLLNGNDPAFPFHHAMAHRTLLGAMSPLNRFSSIPYLLDPPIGAEYPNGWWNRNHQQAHNDALNVLEFKDNHILQEGVPSRPRWIFVNHQEHYLAAASLPPTPWRFPFW